MELTSGEILYRANNIGVSGRALCPEITEDFWQFLDSHHASTAEVQLQTSRTIATTVELYLLKLRHRILTVRKSIELTKSDVMAEIGFEGNNFVFLLEQQQKQFERDALQMVLRYFAIINDEIADSRKRLCDEEAEKEVLCRQAGVLRDVRLFACHLMVESRGRVSFSALPPDSQQFARCVKAVMDNVNLERFKISGQVELKGGVQVLSVFKLQNAFLSSRLQAASERVLNGKIKGLFCCLSREFFYGFSVFGLYAQSLPEAPADTESLSAELFRTAWFHSEPPAGFPVLREVMQTLQVAGTASRLAAKAVRQKVDGKVPGVRFSRYSTISSMAGMGQADLEGGVFLSLCRVLVTQQHTVEGDIRTADIAEALRQGCDCVYSSLTYVTKPAGLHSYALTLTPTMYPCPSYLYHLNPFSEEYVLLQPKFVLPEFFMHVRFPPQMGSLPYGRVSDPLFREADVASPKVESVGAVRKRVDLLGLLACASEAPEGVGEVGGEVCFPVENLLLQNAVASAEGVCLEGGRNNPRQSLMKKQAIVEALHKSVRDFAAIKDGLLKEHADNLARKLVR
ncbi:hypothetical protein B484DRAFT_428922 [Ochromonadaceae sp. CCMP2298]|nr:hypothetical protein B484DRAFT_428922 [Ochromonadaceae sp. CCMP2298]